MTDGRGRTRTDRMAYSRQLDIVNIFWEKCDIAIYYTCVAQLVKSSINTKKPQFSLLQFSCSQEYLPFFWKMNSKSMTKPNSAVTIVHHKRQLTFSSQIKSKTLLSRGDIIPGTLYEGNNAFGWSNIWIVSLLHQLHMICAKYRLFATWKHDIENICHAGTLEICEWGIRDL